MMKCRACLATDSEMFPIDDEFVYNYNILTNLDVKTTDSLCQFVCETCLQSVKLFMEFREKCILSEASLKSTFEEIKNENDVHIKREYEDDDQDDNFLVSLDFNDSSNTDIKEECNDEETSPKLTMIKQFQKKRKGVKAEGKELKSKHLSCGLCTKVFKDKNALSEHFEEHKTSLVCQICHESFNEWPPLVTHRLEHLPPGQKLCHLCPRRFQKMQNYEFHLRRNHFGQKNYRIDCTICMNTYDSPRRLRKHMSAMHSNKTFVCDICNKVCPNKQHLKAHIISHSDKKDFVCDICDFSCKYSHGLKVHKVRRHIAEKIYCVNCKRPFGCQKDYDIHKCNVSAPKICPVCGILLSRSMRLARHMETHKEVGKYKCTRCPKTYKTRSALMAHMDKHDNNPRRHCEYCPAKFFHASALIKHRRTHTGQKPYVCHICHRGFTGNHNLKVHMKVHGIHNLINKKAKPDQTAEKN